MSIIVILEVEDGLLLSAFFWTRPSPLLVSLSKMSSDISPDSGLDSYQNTPALQADFTYAFNFTGAIKYSNEKNIGRQW